LIFRSNSLPSIAEYRTYLCGKQGAGLSFPSFKPKQRPPQTLLAAIEIAPYMCRKAAASRRFDDPVKAL